MNEYALALDLAKAKERQQQTIFVRQGDRNATTIVATITDHGAAAATSGLTARFQMRLPDGTHYYRKAASLSGNVATVALDETQAASVAGRTDVAYFQLLQGSTVVASTESFTVVVLPDALADADVAESYDSAIQDAIDALDAAVEQMPDMVEDVLEAHPEWTTTVQDGSVSDAKLYQGTDGILARVQRLQYRLANMLTNALPEGDVATASDAAKTPVAGLALYGRSTQDGTPTPSAPVPIVSVAGNLYQQTMFAAGTTRTTGGVTVTYNEDGTCTVSGTATSNAWLWGGSSSSDARLYVTLPAGTYTICGSHNVIAQKMVGSTVSNIVSQTVGSATFTLTEETLVKAVPVIPSGTTVSGETAWVALYAGSTAYPYVPYGNVGLWARGKNLLALSPHTVSLADVNCVVTDESITLNGTANSSGGGRLTKQSEVLFLPAGTYTFSVGTNAAGCECYIERVSDNAVLAGTDRSGTFTLSEPTAVYLGINVVPNRTYNNVVISGIQIEFGSVAHAYQPYTYTVTPIDLDGHELRSLPDGTRDELTVGADGRVTLVQRVGVDVFDGDENWQIANRVTQNWFYYLPKDTDVLPTSTLNTMCNAYPAVQVANNNTVQGIWRITNMVRVRWGTEQTVADYKAWLAANPVTLLYPLATPVTHDLGTIDPVPLVGPDLTAQAIPTAPMQLTYERDLNATLARLESAIATLA